MNTKNPRTSGESYQSPDCDAIKWACPATVVCSSDHKNAKSAEYEVSQDDFIW